jgi:type IV pilus assembly protein PilC
MIFEYTASDNKGKTLHGTVEAYSMREAVQRLRTDGLLITGVKPASGKPSILARISGFMNKVGALERVMLTRHLALLLRSGVTVDRSLDIISRQTASKYLKKVTQDVLTSVRKGESLASSLGKHPTVFTKRYVAMVQWGEAGGALAESLDQLATQLEHDRNLLSRVKGALTYPALIFSVMIVVGVLMSVMVLPQMTTIVESFDMELPLPTKIFLAVSNFLTSYILIVVPAGLVLAVLGLLVLRSKPLRPYLHYFMLVVPVFGKIVKMVNLARMNRAMSSLVHSGIPIIDALAITSDVLGNIRYKEAIKVAIAGVKRGEQFSSIIRPYHKLFPPMEVDMIEVGEESGKLGDVLMYLAKFYEGEVNKATKNMAQLIEPIMLVTVGIVVGGIVFAVLMPIYQMSQSIV